MTIKPPHGLEGLIKTFGDPYKIMGDDGVLQPDERAKWEARMRLVPLPKVIPLAWQKTVLARRIRCHEAVADIFARVFDVLAADHILWDHVKTYGGCYEFRTKRSNTEELSVHAWGVAIDLNTATNKMGTVGDMHPGIVQVFEAHGFEWGGRWKRPDGMHFQYCTEY